MEIKSLLSLPKDKRSKASAKELLKALEEAEEQLGVIAESPYYDTYMTLKSQVSDWNEQLKISTEVKTSVGENGITVNTQKGKIDLFADKDSKEFDRAFKYFSDILPILNALDEMRKKLTPEELKKTEGTSEWDSAMEEVKTKLNGGNRN